MIDPQLPIKKIVSGAQTGADRAALDFAINHNIPHGGWVPKGRKAEDGVIPRKYNLQEMTSSAYKKRTEKNVIDSDGTLIISHGKLSGGSKITLDFAHQHNRPSLHIDLHKRSELKAAGEIREWIRTNGIEILNLAESRVSKDPLIYESVYKLLEASLT